MEFRVEWHHVNVQYEQQHLQPSSCRHPCLFDSRFLCAARLWWPTDTSSAPAKKINTVVTQIICRFRTVPICCRSVGPCWVWGLVRPLYSAMWHVVLLLNWSNYDAGIFYPPRLICNVDYTTQWNAALLMKLVNVRVVSTLNPISTSYFTEFVLRLLHTANTYRCIKWQHKNKFEKLKAINKS